MKEASGLYSGFQCTAATETCITALTQQLFKNTKQKSGIPFNQPKNLIPCKFTLKDTFPLDTLIKPGFEA
jgi:hypothetical protein